MAVACLNDCLMIGVLALTLFASFFVVKGERCSFDQGHCSNIHAICVRGPVVHDEITYVCQCSPGFSGNGSFCEEITCPYLAPPKHGRQTRPINVKSRQTKPYTRNDEVAFQCDSGFEATSGELVIQCLADGKWSHKPPICEDTNECIDGSHNCTFSRAKCLNTIGSFLCTCEDKYKRTGPQLCKERTCPPPPPVAHATLWYSTSTGGVIGSQLLTRCDKGYRVVGDKARLCLANGRWSGNVSCIDQNECLEQPISHSCASASNCVNLPGGYYCKNTSGPHPSSSSALLTVSTGGMRKSKSKLSGTIIALIITAILSGILLVLLVVVLTKGRFKSHLETDGTSPRRPSHLDVFLSQVVASTPKANTPVGRFQRAVQRHLSHKLSQSCDSPTEHDGNFSLDAQVKEEAKTVEENAR